MTNKTLKLALGTTFAAGVAMAGVAQADSNPFSAQSLTQGYMVLADNHGKSDVEQAKETVEKKAEGSCGGKASEGACGGKRGEGACGGKKGDGECKADADKDGKVTKEEFLKHHEEMFAKADKNEDGALDAEERKAMHKMKAGACGGDKKGEGACGGKKGEGSCGGDKKAEGSCGGKKGEGSCGGDKKEKSE